MNKVDFKQGTIPEILDSERAMVALGAKRYGEYFDNASEFNNLLNNFIKSVDQPDRFIFMLFYSQVKKHHTLALFSTLRLHHIQAGMDLRQTIEASQWGTYAMNNIEKEKFVEEEDGILVTKDKHEKAMYLWLDQNFLVKANEFKKLKSLISGSVGHSNIAYAFQNFEMGSADDPGFSIPFFDIEDDFHVKSDLWFVANVALGILDLFYGANQKYKVFQLADDFMPRFQALVKKNNELKTEMMNTDRYKNARKLAEK